MRIYAEPCSERDLLDKYHPGDRVGYTRNIQATRIDFENKFNSDFGPDNYLAALYYAPTNDMRKTEDLVMNECVEGISGLRIPILQPQLYSNAPQGPGYVYVLHLTFRY